MSFRSRLLSGTIAFRHKALTIPQIVQNDAGLCCNTRHHCVGIHSVCILTMSGPVSQNLEVRMLTAASRDFPWRGRGKGKTLPMSQSHCSLNAVWQPFGWAGHIGRDTRTPAMNFMGRLRRSASAAGIGADTRKPAHARQNRYCDHDDSKRSRKRNDDFARHTCR